MKLVTYNEGQLGVVKDDQVLPIPAVVAPNMVALIAGWESKAAAVRDIAARAEHPLPLASVKLKAPIPRPGKIMAIGLNYADHVKETGREMPKEQVWFSKMPTAVNGPFDPIQIPKVSSMVDWEAEMVVVIGRRGRHIAKEAAKGHVFGYACGNDVSVRDWQKRTPQWTIGKSFDTHAPFGPWITTADEIDAGGLGIRSFVNGELRQSSNTAQMLFDCAAQIEHLSQAMTLEPGDLIYTGTPAGVGMARNPPLYLKPGDVVRVEIDGLGAIQNRVEAASGEMRME